MVGSRDSIAPANVVLNTIVAEAFKEVCDVLENAEDVDMAVHDLIKKNLLSIRELYLMEMVIQMNGWKKQNEEDFQTSDVW